MAIRMGCFIQEVAWSSMRAISEFAWKPATKFILITALITISNLQLARKSVYDIRRRTRINRSHARCLLLAGHSRGRLTEKTGTGVLWSWPLQADNIWERTRIYAKDQLLCTIRN